MKQESKGLLLKDLCARLPYGVICEFYYGKGTIVEEMGIGGLHDFMFGNMEAKPYLRPMSSMIEEEFEEYSGLVEHISIGNLQANIANPESFDWLNAHHFDFRGLIEKNLAIDCTGLHIYD